ncbi:MAG: hypothetical protein Fur0019_18820 [Tibeticola sp.]
MRRRLLNMLIALDQLLWVLTTLGNGAPDETISAAAYRMERQGKLAGRALRPLIDLLFSPIEREHCRKAYLSEMFCTQQNSEYRRYSD